MGFKSEEQIPCLDFSKDLSEGSDGWKNLSKQVREACEVYGVFQVVYDNMPTGRCEEMIKAAEELFDLPDETKMKNKGSRPFYGYIGKHDEVPLYESLGIEDAPNLKAAQAFTQLMWPDGNPALCQTINSVSLKMHELGLIVVKLIMESYGVEKYFNSYVESNEAVVRLMRYKAPECNTSEVALKAHTDKSALTILYQNSVHGLEVLSKEDNWLPVVPSPGSLTVFIGDGLKAWSNGRLHAVKHRVVMRGDKTRYSFAMFTPPKEAVVMEAPKELIDEEHPQLFRPFKYVDFLNHYYATHDDNNGLDTYAGL